jgi:hypothetical protein
MREVMPVPRWFQRELQLINENYFCAWNPRLMEFQVRQWTSKFYRPTVIVDIFKNSKSVHSIPYVDFDERALYGLRLGLYNARTIARLLREVDEANRQNELQADREDTYQHRAAAKDIWRHYKHPRVFLNRK